MTAAYLTNVTTSVTNLQSSLTAISPLKNATFAQLMPVVLQAQQTLSTIDAAIMTLDATIGNASSPGFAGVVAGGFAPAMVTALLGQLANMQNMVGLLTLRAYVGRLVFNLEQTVT